MKKLLLLLLLVASVTASQAQSKGYNDSDTISFPQGFLNTKPTIKDRLHFGVSMGTSVSFARGQDGIMGHFIAPILSFQVSPKFRVNGGVSLQYNSLNNPWTYGTGENGSNIMLVRPKVQTFMFASGEYALNPKLTLTGSVFASTATLNMPGLNPSTYNLNSYGASAGFWYKINDKASFGAQVQFSRGNPYQRYNGGMYNDGSMMGGGFGNGLRHPYSPAGNW
ncbi:hypothetical protein BH09BAC1_BH09BAC1_01630 [soil metagenome]